MSDSIADIVNGVVDGSLSDELVIDWLRDIFENGLDENSTIFLTKSNITPKERETTVGGKRQKRDGV